MKTAIGLWENREQAEAFRARAQEWSNMLEEHGCRLESRTPGAVIR